MVNTPTPNLRLPNATVGDTGWGVTENTARTMVDQAAAGELTLSVAGAANVVLSTADSTFAGNNALNAHFVLTGVLTGNIVVLWPNGFQRNFTVLNSTTGAFTLSIGVNNGSSLPAGTTVALPRNLSAFLLSDGTNVTTRFNSFVGGLTVDTLTLTNPLGAASGGTGLATLTLNNVLLGNGTSAVQLVAPGTSGNVLTSNGTIWASAAPTGGVTSLADATNGGLNVSAATGAVTVKLQPSDLLTKAAPTLADSVIIEDAAAANAAKASTLAQAYGLLRGYLGGLTLSNDGGTPNTKLDIAAGVCADSTNAVMISLGAFTKTTANPWVAGTGNAGASAAIGTSQWWHVFAIINAGAADVYFDTSVTAANKPASTTAFRRIGSFRVDGSGNILTFSQLGDEFYWLAPISDSTTVPTGTAASYTLTTPLGVKTGAILTMVVSTSQSDDVYFSPLDTNDIAANTAPTLATQGATANAARVYNLRTNTSSQVRGRSLGFVTAFSLVTYGWIDTRGRND